MFGRWSRTTETFVYRVIHAWNFGHKRQVAADHRDRKKQFLLYIYKYIIQTESRVFTGFKDRDKKIEVQPRFLSRLFKSRKHEGEVCIIFKSMKIKPR